MNRRTKIIVSVSSIFLVLLILLGLTFAYFLTRINGNSNTKSISVTTANLELTYLDGNGVLEPFGLIQPGDDIHFTDGSNNEVTSKTFSVTNNGDKSVTYSIFLINIISNMEHIEDIKYTLTCTSGCTSNTTVTNQTFPKYDSEIMEQTIASGATQQFTLTMKYQETNTDQSVDMNTTLTAKIQIFGSNGDNDVIPFEPNTLAYNILNNAKKATSTEIANHYAEYSPTPKTQPAVAVNGANEGTLSLTQDDLGTSYYFRGNVVNNYVNFAGMCWRIVRIEGNGSVKLILEDADNTCNSQDYTGNWTIGGTIAFGYNSNNRIDFLGYTGGLKTELNNYETILNTKIISNHNNKTKTDYLKQGDWCYDNSIASSTSYGYDDDWNTVYSEVEAVNGWYTEEYYGAYTRIYTDKQPSLKCAGQKLKNMYVGTITADEVSFAGGYSGENYNYYLMNNYFNDCGFDGFWVLSPVYFYEEDEYDRAFLVDALGNLDYINVSSVNYVARPAVSLKSGTLINTGGNGTLGSPYEIQ